MQGNGGTMSTPPRGSQALIPISAIQETNTRGVDHIFGASPYQCFPMKISRQAYAEMFGPTLGDRIRLADTESGYRDREGLHRLWRRGKVWRW